MTNEPGSFHHGTASLDKAASNQGTESLAKTEAESQAVYKPGAKRVTLAYIESRIASVTHYQGESLEVMTICEVLVDNGYVVLGKSAPLDPTNFDAEYGKKLAYDDCIRQLWPLFAFAERENIKRAAEVRTELDKALPEVTGTTGEEFGAQLATIYVAARTYDQHPDAVQGGCGAYHTDQQPVHVRAWKAGE